MQKNLKLNDKITIGGVYDNSANFVFHLNSSSLAYHEPKSIYLRIYNMLGEVYYDGCLWDLFVFQRYFVKNQDNINAVLRRMTTWYYEPTYFNIGSFDTICIFYPQGFSIDVVCGSNFGRYVQDVNVFTSVSEDCAIPMDNIKKLNFDDNNIRLDFTSNYMLLAPQLVSAVDTSLSYYAQNNFNIGYSLVNDGLTKNVGDIHADMADYSFSGVTTAQYKSLYTVLRNVKYGSQLRKYVVGNITDCPVIIYYV